MEADRASGATLLQIDGLRLRFSQQVLFADFSVCIPPGVTSVQGGEGSGKTTLLRLMAGELAADAVRLRVNGTSLADQPQSYRSQVFWADPRSDALDALTPVAYWAAVQQRYPAFDAQLLADLVDGLSLAQHQDKALYMLSTGSKRKVWLAAAFASGAAVTLLDEPFAALDKASINLVLELLHDASTHATRAWVVADYEAPRGVRLASTISL
jgi:ABC-type multidrug transport system ATPase subunit|nr:ATP-binding cassette domain-containing protein [Rhodoferax sp.]